jgi:hypothetical protein
VVFIPSDRRRDLPKSYQRFLILKNAGIASRQRPIAVKAIKFNVLGNFYRPGKNTACIILGHCWAEKSHSFGAFAPTVPRLPDSQGQK